MGNGTAHRQAHTPMKLTENQIVALRFVARVCDSPEFGHEVDGVCPRRGQSQMFERLRLLGLLEDAGIGVHADSHDREVQLYTITEHGRRELQLRAAIERARKAQEEQ